MSIVRARSFWRSSLESSFFETRCDKMFIQFVKRTKSGRLAVTHSSIASSLRLFRRTKSGFCGSVREKQDQAKKIRFHVLNHHWKPKILNKKVTYPVCWCYLLVASWDPPLSRRTTQRKEYQTDSSSRPVIKFKNYVMIECLLYLLRFTVYTSARVVL